LISAPVGKWKKYSHEWDLVLYIGRLHFLTYTPFTRWSWLDELALRALVVEPARRASFIV